MGVKIPWFYPFSSPGGWDYRESLLGFPVEDCSFHSSPTRREGTGRASSPPGPRCAAALFALPVGGEIEAWQPDMTKNWFAWKSGAQKYWLSPKKIDIGVRHSGVRHMSQPRFSPERHCCWDFSWFTGPFWIILGRLPGLRFSWWGWTASHLPKIQQKPKQRSSWSFHVFTNVLLRKYVCTRGSRWYHLVI